MNAHLPTGQAAIQLPAAQEGGGLGVGIADVVRMEL